MAGKELVWRSEESDKVRKEKKDKKRKEKKEER